MSNVQGAMSNSRPMKDSGVEWIGEIPELWSIIKFKYLFSIVGGNGFPDVLQGNETGDYPFCKVSDINSSEATVSTAANYVSESVASENRFNVIPVNSILMAKIGAALSRNHRKINTVPCCIDNNTQALVVRRNDYIKFLYYLTKCIDMSWFDNNSTVPSINNGKLLAFFVPDVAIAEQRRIADFLDRRCAEIDGVIEATKKTIEEYKALKQSIITEAVTKGVRGVRPMKDSGIEWIGELPAEWEVVRLKSLFDFGKGLPITKENLIESGIPVISYGQIHSKITTGVELQQHLYRYVDAAYVESNPQSLVHKGDFIFADTSEDLDGCGNAVYIDNELTLFAGYHTIVFSSKGEKNNKFLAYLFRTDAWRSQIRSKVSGVKVLSISRRILADATVVIPNIDEREAIVAYLDDKCKEINRIIERKQELLTEFEMYKKSVIYEYVTGKRGVPND